MSAVEFAESGVSPTVSDRPRHVPSHNAYPHIKLERKTREARLHARRAIFSPAIHEARREAALAPSIFTITQLAAAFQP